MSPGLHGSRLCHVCLWSRKHLEDVCLVKGQEVKEQILQRVRLTLPQGALIPTSYWLRHTTTTIKPNHLESFIYYTNSLPVQGLTSKSYEEIYCFISSMNRGYRVLPTMFCKEFFAEMNSVYEAKQPSIPREQNVGHIPTGHVQSTFISWIMSNLISQGQISVKEDGLCTLRALSKCVSPCGSSTETNSICLWRRDNLRSVLKATCP